MSAPGAWLAACPAALRPTVEAYVAGELPAPVALMRLLMDSDAASLAATLDGLTGEAAGKPACAEAAERIRDLRDLLGAHPDAAATIKSILDVLAHDRRLGSEAEAIAYWRDGFDRAAAISPAASVALYSLGSPALLSATTAEIAGRLADWGVLKADRQVLDVGCGTGRLEAALASRVRQVVGVDISSKMLDAARRRCAAWPNVHFVQVSGRDLAPIASASSDLVLAVDCFPYLVQSGAGLVERHFGEAARVLRPGGDLVIANFSYRGDAERDRRDAARLGGRAGFRVVRAGTRAFTSWDGLAFHLVKVA